MQSKTPAMPQIPLLEGYNFVETVSVIFTYMFSIDVIVGGRFTLQRITLRVVSNVFTNMFT